MFFKKSLAASGYITSLFGGGYVAYDYLQEKNIGDLLAKFSKPYDTNEEFQRAYFLLKEDSQFKQDISGISNLNDVNGPELLKSWCSSKYGLELTEHNIKMIFPKVERYCSDIGESKTSSTNIGDSLNWRKLKKQIAKKGISEKGQLFVKATTGKGKGREKTTGYCWNTERNNWVSSNSEGICWEKNGVS